MEENFALLNMKRTDLWKYSAVLTHALEVLTPDTKLISWKQYDKIWKLRDTLVDAATKAI